MMTEKTHDKLPPLEREELDQQVESELEFLIQPAVVVVLFFVLPILGYVSLGGWGLVAAVLLTFSTFIHALSRKPPK